MTKKKPWGGQKKLPDGFLDHLDWTQLMSAMIGELDKIGDEANEAGKAECAKAIYRASNAVSKAYSVVGDDLARRFPKLIVVSDRRG